MKAFFYAFIRTGGKQPNKTWNSMQGEGERNAEENNYGFYFIGKP